MASIVSKRSDTGKIKLIDRVQEAIRLKHYSVAEEIVHLVRPHLAGVSLPVKDNEPLDPVDVGLLGS
jgi:hypothetical protein